MLRYKETAISNSNQFLLLKRHETPRCLLPPDHKMDEAVVKLSVSIVNFQTLVTIGCIPITYRGAVIQLLHTYSHTGISHNISLIENVGKWSSSQHHTQQLLLRTCYFIQIYRELCFCVRTASSHSLITFSACGSQLKPRGQYSLDSERYRCSVAPRAAGALQASRFPCKVSQMLQKRVSGLAPLRSSQGINKGCHPHTLSLRCSERGPRSPLERKERHNLRQTRQNAAMSCKATR